MSLLYNTNVPASYVVCTYCLDNAAASIVTAGCGGGVWTYVMYLIGVVCAYCLDNADASIVTSGCGGGVWTYVNKFVI